MASRPVADQPGEGRSKPRASGEQAWWWAEGGAEVVGRSVHRPDSGGNAMISGRRGVGGKTAHLFAGGISCQTLGDECVHSAVTMEPPPTSGGLRDMFIHKVDPLAPKGGR